jgi:hypothetical protein
MALVIAVVVAAFGGLYFAVAAEEQRLREATKPRKR